MAYKVICSFFIYSLSFHSCTQIMWDINFQSNKYIENVAFHLPHFAIKYRYPCMSLCLIAHLMASSNEIYNHIHSFDDDFNNWKCNINNIIKDNKKTASAAAAKQKI